MLGRLLGLKRSSFIFSLFFLSHVYVSLSTLRFSTLFHNDPAAHQDHCRRCRIRTRDLCTDEPPHLYLSLWEWKGGSQDARKVVIVGRYILVYVCK